VRTWPGGDARADATWCRRSSRCRRASIEMPRERVSRWAVSLQTLRACSRATTRCSPTRRVGKAPVH
jgi:hypothetical protein